MKKIIPLAAAVSLLLPLFSNAQEVRFQPEPDFDAVVSRAIAKMAPSDAFAGPACRVVDAKFMAPVGLEDAQKLLAPCLENLSSRYGTKLTLEAGTAAEQGRMSAQVEELILAVPDGASMASPVMRDLSHGLALRRNLLLGHPVVIRRDDPRVSAESVKSANPAQEALASCVMPMVMRRVESGADFIRYYGHCLRRAQALKIVDLKPWAAHPMGVIVITDAARPVAERLTTTVSVRAANGPVQIDLVAYTQPVFRP